MWVSPPASIVSVWPSWVGWRPTIFSVSPLIPSEIKRSPRSVAISATRVEAGSSIHTTAAPSGSITSLERREEFGGGLGEGAARFGIGDMNRAFDERLGPGEHRDRAGGDRVGNIILAVRHGAAKGAEHGSGRDFAAVDREAGDARIHPVL